MAAHTENSVLIAAPRPLVWEITNDIERWPGLFTEYAKAEVLARTGDTVRFRLTMRPDDDGNEWSWVSERTMNPADWTVDAQRIETGWFAYMRLRWIYEEEGEGTRLTWIQDFTMKPDSPFDDRQMAQRINTNSAVQMEAVRAKVEAAAPTPFRVVAIDDVPANTRRGGEIRTMLSPATVGSTSGFMGAVILRPGERIGEHYHPYSEEFLCLIRGALTLDLDDEPVALLPGQAVYIPINVRHRLRNTGDEDVLAIFHLGPLAPRPELGHVDTEAAETGRVT